MKRLLKIVWCGLFHVDAPVDIKPDAGDHHPVVALFLGRCYCSKCGLDLTP